VDHEEEYCRAIDLYEADDFASAFVIFEQLANAGQPHAMAMLATMYGAGQFVAKNIPVSLAWDMKSIALGNKTSVSNIAITYCQNGDLKLAEEWFLKAVAAGDGDANLELAKMKLESNGYTVEVEKLLRDAVASKSITEYSIEEAKEILSLYAAKKDF
jgi:uncharacterized protein